MKDTYGREIRYLRLSVTDRCNLRCRYCMPVEGICKKRHEDMMTEDEMVTAVRAAASLGVDKIRVTGGEPLVKKNIVSLCRRVAGVDGIREVCLTTNGLLLPELAGELKAAGVRRLNISLDTLDAAKYAYITRTGTLEQALRGIEAALAAGFERVKLNAVLIGGFNDDEIPALADLSCRWPVDVRFIELMPMTAVETFGQSAYLPCQAVVEALPQLAEIPSQGGVARLYRLPEGQGNIGLISAVSNHFCGCCDRLRLTADGKVKPCLHSGQELPLKGLDEDGMRRVMAAAIQAKPPCHPPLSSAARSGAGRNMNEIGG